MIKRSAVRFESIRTVSALAVETGLKLHQMNVNTAFFSMAT